MREKIDENKKERAQGVVITIAKTIGEMDVQTKRLGSRGEKRERVVCGFSYELNSFDFE